MPAIFGEAIWNQELIFNLVYAILGFSLLSSAIYIQNDIADRNLDALHPEKSKRLIASGDVKVKTAVAIGASLLIVGLLLLLWLSFSSFLVGLAYLSLNVIYTWIVKHIPVLDVIFLVQGYWLRLILGSIVADMTLSYWVLGVVSLIAVYIVLCKRLGDVEVFRKTGKKVRKTVSVYAQLPVKGMLGIIAILIGAFFLIYIIIVHNLNEEHFTPWVYACVPLVWLSLFRFHRNIVRSPSKDPLSVLFKDWGTVLPVFIGFLILCSTLYFK